MGRFVDTQAKTRYTLSDGEDWVEFRNELSFGESREAQSGALRGHVDQETQNLDVDIDWGAYDVVRLSKWLVDWSFTDGDGEDAKKMPASKSSIALLNEATATELIELLDKHVDSQDGPGKEESGEAS